MIGITLGLNGLLGSGEKQYAMRFNGTTQYFGLPLPSDLAVFTPSTISAGNPPTGWSKSGTPTITYETTEPGSAGCMKMVVGTNNHGAFKTAVKYNKQYKVVMRCKASADFSITDGGFGGVTISGGVKATSEWNTVSFLFKPNRTGQANDNNELYITGNAGTTIFIESISIKLDQKLNLSKDQEMLLHSKNWNFERTLGTELAAGTVTIGSKYIVTAGTVEGNAVGAEFLAITNATTLDASNKVKPIPNLVTNGTFEDTSNWSIGAGWAIDTTNKKAVATSVSTPISFTAYTLQANKRYRLTFQVLAVTSGSARGRVGTWYGTIRSTTGVFTEDFTAPSSTVLGIQEGTAFTGEIDNIHIYEIPEWTSTGNHTKDISIIDKHEGTQSLLVTATGAGRGAEVLTNGDITGSATGWTINGTTCTYGTNNFNCVDVNNSSACNNNVDLVIGTTYEIIYTITRTTGSMKFRAGTGHVGTARTASGTYVEIATCATTTKLFLDGTGFYGTIESVSVKVYSGEVSLPTANLESCVSGKKYTLEGFARSDAGSITITAVLGSKTVTSSTLSTVAGTFTKFVLNFLATASEASQDLKLYLSGAGNVFVDKLSLTQAYDMWVGGKSKITRTGSNGILGTLLATPMQVGFLTTTTNFRSEIGLSNTNYVGTDTATPITDSVWHLLKYTINRTGNATVQADSGTAVNASMSAIGKHIMSQAFLIGRIWVGYMQGQISNIQIIRFDDIDQSTFNPATIGLQYPTGGGAEEVLRLDWKGANFAAAIKDKSPVGNDLTAYNMDITNREVVI